jgi:hypothetical protein
MRRRRESGGFREPRGAGTKTDGVGELGVGRVFTALIREDLKRLLWKHTSESTHEDNRARGRAAFE